MTYNADYSTDTLPDIDTDFSFCSTDDDGRFTFMFNNPGLGLVAEKITATRTLIGITQVGVSINGVEYAPDESIEVTKGDLYMYANLIVDNFYYTSPTLEVQTPKGDNADLGIITTKVRSYDLTVNVKADKSYKNQYKQDNIESMVVYVLRDNHPEGVPGNEGKGSQSVEPGEKLFNMQVVAKEITGNTGLATLRNLVRNQYNNPYDRYYIYATALASSDVNYTMDAPVLYSYYHYGDDAVFSPDYKLPSPVPSKEVVARPLPPAIKGSVYRYDDQMQAVKDAHVQLFNMVYIVDSDKTGPNGKFSFELPGSKEGDKWALYVTHVRALRYKYVTVPYSLILGKKYVREDILMEPEANITGTVINEKGEGIRVHIRMDDGAYKEFQPFCPDFSFTQGINQNVTDNITGNSSGKKANTVVPISEKPMGQVVHYVNSSSGSGAVVSNVSNMAVQGGQSAAVNSPSIVSGGMVADVNLPPPCNTPTPFTLYSTSGNHRLIIDPVDPDYLNDTIENIVVQKDKNVLPPITVYTKKHRILVKVRVRNYSGSVSVGAPVQDAIVKAGIFGTGTTNNLGEVSFEYSSASDTVKLYVEGPPQHDYVPTVKTAFADESKDFRVITVLLKPGGRIKGTVYAGTTDSSAVASARVYADIPGEIKIETMSDAQGKYELRNVPLNMKLVVRAVKSVSNYVGDSLLVQIYEDGTISIRGA